MSTWEGMTQSTKSSRGGFLLGAGFLMSFAMFALSAPPAAIADGKKVGAGGKCESDADCESRSCESKVCKRRSGEKVDAGGKCVYSQECKSDLCDHGTCARRGYDKVETGGKCNYSQDCKSNKCEKSVCVK